MSEENQWQYCKKCNRDMRFEFHIRDEIWEKLPPRWKNHVLCMECFLEELEIAEPNQKLGISDFAFLCIVGDNNFGGIILDNSLMEKLDEFEMIRSFEFKTRDIFRNI